MEPAALRACLAARPLLSLAVGVSASTKSLPASAASPLQFSKPAVPALPLAWKRLPNRPVSWGALMEKVWTGSAPLKESMPKMQSLLATQVPAQQKKELMDSLGDEEAADVNSLGGPCADAYLLPTPKVENYLRSQTITFVSIFVTGCS